MGDQAGAARYNAVSSMYLVDFLGTVLGSVPVALEALGSQPYCRWASAMPGLYPARYLPRYIGRLGSWSSVAVPTPDCPERRTQ